MDEYTYIRTCGEGAYGDVWLTRRADGVLVAVKVFKQAHEDAEIKALAKREARILQNLKHINIVRVFEFCERSVFDELDANPYGLPSRATKLLAWQLLHAAAYLHDRKQICHRDIKPANILLTGDGVLKLCDFGFARDVPHGGKAAGVGPRDLAAAMSTYVVTRWYRPPEVLVSDAYGPPVDIWSIGCTIAEIATGRPLFPGKSTADQLWRIMRCLGPLTPGQTARMLSDRRLRGATVPPLHKTLRQRLPELEPRLFQLVEACLAPEPRQRPTAAELLAFPYFWDVPQLVAGTALAELYSGKGGVGQQGGRAGARPAGQGQIPGQGVGQQRAPGQTAAASAAPVAAAAAQAPSSVDTPVGVSVMQMSARQLAKLQQGLHLHHLEQQEQQEDAAARKAQEGTAAAAAIATAQTNPRASSSKPLPKLQISAGALEVVNLQQQLQTTQQAAAPLSTSGAPSTAVAAATPADADAVADAPGKAGTAATAPAAAAGAEGSAMDIDGECLQAAPGGNSGQPQQQQLKSGAGGAPGGGAASVGVDSVMQEMAAAATAAATAAARSSGREHARDIGQQGAVGDDSDGGGEPQHQRRRLLDPAAAAAAAGGGQMPGTAAAAAAMAAAAVAAATASDCSPHACLVDTQSLEHHFEDAAAMEGAVCRDAAGENARGEVASELDEMPPAALLCSITGTQHIAEALAAVEHGDQPETLAGPHTAGSSDTRGGSSTADGGSCGVAGGSLPGPRVLQALAGSQKARWGGEARASDASADPGLRALQLPPARGISTVAELTPPAHPPVPAPVTAPALPAAAGSVAAAAAAPVVQSLMNAVTARGSTSHSATAGASAATATTEDDCHESERYDGLAELRGSTAGRTSRATANPIMLQYQPYMVAAAGGGEGAGAARGSESGRFGVLPLGSSGPLGSLMGGDRTSAATAITLSSALPAALGQQDGCTGDGGLSGFGSASALSFATNNRYTGPAVGESWHTSQPKATLPAWASPSPFSADAATAAPSGGRGAAAHGAAVSAAGGPTGAASLTGEHTHGSGGGDSTQSDTRLLRLASSGVVAGHSHLGAGMRTAMERRAAAAAAAAAAASTNGAAAGRSMAWPHRGRGAQIAAYRVSASGSLARLPEGVVVAADDTASPLSPSDAPGASAFSGPLFRSQDMAAGGGGAGGRSLLAATMAARVSVGNRIAAQAAYRASVSGVPGASGGSGSGAFAGFPAAGGLLSATGGGGSVGDGGAAAAGARPARPSGLSSFSGAPGMPLSTELLSPGGGGGGLTGGGGGGSCTPSYGNTALHSGQLHSQILNTDYSIPLHDLFMPHGAPELPAYAGLLPPHRRPPQAASPWAPPSAANSDSLFLLSGLGLPRGTTQTSLPRTHTAGMSDSDRPSPSDGGDPERPSPPGADVDSVMALSPSDGAGGEGGGANGSAKNGGRFWSSLIGRMSMRSSISSSAGAAAGAAAAAAVAAGGSMAGDGYGGARTVSGSAVGGRALLSDSGGGQPPAGQPPGFGQAPVRRSNSKVPAAPAPAARSRLGSGTWGEPPCLAAAGASVGTPAGSGTRGFSGSGVASSVLMQPVQRTAAAAAAGSSASSLNKPIMTGVLSVTAAISRGNQARVNSGGLPAKGDAGSTTGGQPLSAQSPVTPGALLTMGEEKALPATFGGGGGGRVGSESLAVLLGAGVQLMSADGGGGDGGTGPVARPPSCISVLGGTREVAGNNSAVRSGGRPLSGVVSAGVADRPRSSGRVHALPLLAAAVPQVAEHGEHHDPSRAAASQAVAHGAAEAGANGGAAAVAGAGRVSASGAAGQGRAAAVAAIPVQLQDVSGRGTKSSSGIKSLVKGVANVLGLRKPSSRGKA
ncbi:hypothetical protein HXX76_009948 [Chlamydomonas incerta]|uniref:Protein kinase domain-containing protein n=1 Tax=Chlamydomonas incerta TaxID=51695 RepID=A0A835VYD3_CHLIN|nr:hypothetical protein HXX76_009948 [Chlamydomonas incerta]|eukprot:KAG2430423.1 hypothetical protein HXX76_009948 [Chlamydomonas incerta]